MRLIIVRRTILFLVDCTIDTRGHIGDNASGSGREESIEQKLDKNGLPLVPQPSSDPSDPLNFPQWLKVVILIQASVMALLGPFNTAVINPGNFSVDSRSNMGKLT